MVYIKPIIVTITSTQTIKSYIMTILGSHPMRHEFVALIFYRERNMSWYLSLSQPQTVSHLPSSLWVLIINSHPLANWLLAVNSLTSNNKHNPGDTLRSKSIQEHILTTFKGQFHLVAVFTKYDTDTE